MRSHSLFRIAGVVAALAACNALTGVGSLEVVPDGDVPLPSDDGSTTSDVSVDAPSAKDVVAFDAPVEAGVTFCPSFTVFCDDYETGNLIKWTSLFQTNGGKVTVVDTPVFAGKKSMRVLAPTSTGIDAADPPAVGAGSRITIPVVTTGMLAVHARVFLPKALANDTTFIKVFGKNGVDDMNVKSATGGNVKVDGDTPDAGAEKIGNKPLPVATWFCIEWQTTVGTSGHQRLLVDNATVVDADEDTSTSMGFDSVQIGFQASNGALTQEALFDDVSIATQPIGCP